MRQTLFFVLLCLGLCSVTRGSAEERTAHFDQDPQWESNNNRRGQSQQRKVKQDFGYSASEQRVGGLITTAAEPAYYAKPIRPWNLNTPLTASGIVECPGRKYNILIGFFNKDTLGGWRTPNTLALRLNGRGDHFYAYLEYCTDKFRAGGDSPKGFSEPDPTTGKSKPIHFPRYEALKWSLRYDPLANEGKGALYAKIGEREAICELAPGHRVDGATFNRFGFLNVMKSADDAGEVYLRDVEVMGTKDSFTKDPHWDGFQNRREYTTSVIRPQFNFGYSNTQFAGGQTRGEIGGQVFRGDARYADTLASYADRLEPLTLDRPIKASGRIVLLRAVSDSTTLFGFFNSKSSLQVREQVKSGFPSDFLGVAIEGPSSEGFFAYPLLQFENKGVHGRGLSPPYIYPDGKSHTWRLEYTPLENGKGLIQLSLDEKSMKMEITRPNGETTHFDRFGILTTCIDGNGQIVYWDDLSYTFRQ